MLGERSDEILFLIVTIVVGMWRMYSRKLIEDFNAVPKNYQIIYKYIGAKYREVVYLKIDVNVSSYKSF